MKGFFTKEEVPELTRGPQQVQLGCGTCGLFRTCRSPKMPVSGDGRKGILVVAEAPGKTGDQENTQFVGEAGQLFRRKLRSLGVDLDRDCWKTNAVCCRPTDAKGNNRVPKPQEVAACRPRLWDSIRELRPKLIILCGGVPVQSLYGDRWRHDPLDGIARWRGWTIPDREAQAWVAPVSRLRDLLRSKDAKGGPLATDLIFTQDLKRALERLHEPFPVGEAGREESLVRIIKDEGELNSFLIWLLRHYEEEDYRPLCVADLETTGLKPHREGHEIWTCALSWDPDAAVAFPWPKGEHPRRRLHRLFHHPAIRKVAQNLPYEDSWLAHFGFPVQGWEWDTLLASHTLDNRPKICGLKWQAMVQFGVLGYDGDVAPFLEPTAAEKKAHGANAFNRIREAPLDRVLLYDGMDVLLTHRLALQQRAIMGVRDR